MKKSICEQRREILESPSEVAIYERLGKPLPGEAAVILQRELPKLQEKIDEMLDVLRQWGEAIRLREAAEQGAVFTSIDEEENQLEAGHEPTTKLRPAPVAGVALKTVMQFKKGA